jgi:hypothetical protein
MVVMVVRSSYSFHSCRCCCFSFGFFSDASSPGCALLDLDLTALAVAPVTCAAWHLFDSRLLCVSEPVRSQTNLLLPPPASMACLLDCVLDLTRHASTRPHRNVGLVARLLRETAIAICEACEYAYERIRRLSPR